MERCCSFCSLLVLPQLCAILPFIILTHHVTLGFTTQQHAARRCPNLSSIPFPTRSCAAKQSLRIDLIGSNNIHRSGRRSKDIASSLDSYNETDEQNTSSLDALLANLSKDLSHLTKIRPATPAADISCSPAIISAGSSYTRLWTQMTWWRHANPPHIRYFRHMRSWPLSTSARKILPAVVMSALYTLTTAFALRHLRIGQYLLGSLTKGASAAMTALGAPLALLLTLRANASLGRLNEARQLCGRLILHGRHLASFLRVYVQPSNPQAAIMAARYLSVLGWSIKALVRYESDDSQREVYTTMLGKKEADWIISQPISNPVAIVYRLRQIVAEVGMKSNNPNFFVPHSAMEQCINDLDAVTGGLERLLGSPIPPTYSRHLSRIMVMYLANLPLALVASGTPSLGAMVAGALVSYVLIGVDEIGMEIENPFPLLPLQQICGALQNIVGNHMLLPDIPQNIET